MTKPDSIAPPNGLVKFRILPEGFKLEVTIDDAGHYVTAKMGHASFGVGVSPRANWNWLAHCGAELQELFFRTYHCHANMLSSCEPDGAFLVWLRSSAPAPKVALDSAPAQRMLKNEKAADAVIDFEAVQRGLAKRLTRRIDEDIKGKLLGLPDVIDI